MTEHKEEERERKKPTLQQRNVLDTDANWK